MSFSKMCCLDLETTGFSPADDSIIEVALICLDGGVEVDRFEALIRPDKSPLTDFVSGLTGITDAMLKREAKHWSSVKEIVQEKIAGRVIMGHNISFDLGFLAANGIDLSTTHAADSHQLSRILLINEPSYALEILSAQYGFTHTDAHRAMSDVEANIALWNVLTEKVKAAPAAWLKQIQPMLKHVQDWYLGRIFTEYEGAPFEAPEKAPTLTVAPEQSHEALLEGLVPGVVECVSHGGAVESAAWLTDVARAAVMQGQKVAIITPKLTFFEEGKAFPTPDVLLDAERLQHFIGAETLTEEEVVLGLKCLHRHAHGLRGKSHMNLFLHEKGMWGRLCQTAESSAYAAVLKEKCAERFLKMSPYAYAKYAEHFADRVLLVDELEGFTEGVLRGGAHTVSLRAYLDDPDTEAAAAFIVRDWVRDVLEPALGRPLGTYPEWTLLPGGTAYAEQADRLLTLSNTLAPVAQVLQDTSGAYPRWIKYSPHSGDLQFGWMPPQHMLTIQAGLASRKIVAMHQSDYGPTMAQFWLKCETRLADSPFAERPPAQLVHGVGSVKANDFVVRAAASLVEQIRSTNAQQVLVHAPGLVTIRGLHAALEPVLGDFVVLGEQVAGGRGKLLHKLKNVPEGVKVLLIVNMTEEPAVAARAWDLLALMKIPFRPPDPLLAWIEEDQKRQGVRNLWNEMAAPRVAARLGRMVGLAPKARVLLFDGRAKMRWGHELMAALFPTLL